MDIRTFIDAGQPICNRCGKLISNPDLVHKIIGFDGKDLPEVCANCFQEIISDGKHFGSVRKRGDRLNTFN